MQHYLVAVEHLTLGKLLFLPLLGGILLTARWCAGTVEPTVTAASGIVAGPLPRWSAVPPAGLVLASMLVTLHPAAGAAQLGGAPLGTGGWEGPLPAQSGWMPGFGDADDQQRLSYQSPDRKSLELYVNLYASQRSGKELVQYNNTLLAPSGWTRPWSSGGSRLSTAGGRALWAFEARAPDEQLWLIAYTYRVGGGLYISEAAAQLAYGMRSLFGPAPAGVVAFASVCDATNCDKARTLVADFWNNMSSPILSMLPD
jgi:EpsI family protein